MRRTAQLLTLSILVVSCVLLAGPANMSGQQTGSNQAALTLKQVKQRLKQNKQYLKEAQKKGKAGDTAGMTTALTNYDRGMEGLNTALSKGQFQGSPSQLEDAYNRVQTATSKHETILQNLMDKMPNQQAKDAITKAMTVSEKGHDTATAQLQGLHAQQGMGQANRPSFGQSGGMGRSEGAGRPGGMGGFGAANSPMGGSMGGGAMGHPGGGPAMGGGHGR